MKLLEFDKAIARVLPIEGGLSMRRSDPGNWTGGHVGVGKLLGTKYGIAANTYPTLDIKNLTWDDAKVIYKRDFWDKVHAGTELPAAVAFSGLDGAINSGQARSIAWLQFAAHVTADGVWGPVTRAAIAAADPNDMLLRYLAKRQRFMTGLGNWAENSRGWAIRICDCMLFGAEDN